MSGYSWPDQGSYDPDRLRRGWPAAITMLPIGTCITGKVIARQPFGVFIAIDGAPTALGLAEITSMPRDIVLPTVGTIVAGEVIWHAEHNHQIKLRLLTNARPDPAAADPARRRIAAGHQHAANGADKGKSRCVTNYSRHVRMSAEGCS